MKNIILKAKDLEKSFFSNKEKLYLLQKVSFVLEKGFSMAIMGASGEGKTTLLHILGGLEPFTSGEIFINNILLKKKNSATFRKEKLAFIFQTYNLLEDLSVIENIIMPAKISRKLNPAIYQKSLILLDELNLSSKKNICAKNLSGGEKQRVAIARAFCNDPDIILADEPTGNLDHKNSKIIHDLLIQFSKKKNKSLIVATHDEELANLCDKKFLLSNGKLEQIK